MTVTMPKLEKGRIYQPEEVATYIGEQVGSSDFSVAKSGFPRNIQTWQPDSIAWRDEQILLQYKVFDLQDFKEQIRSLEADYLGLADHRKRVEDIVAILRKKHPFFPVFVQYNDPHRRIIEGQHRSIALLSLESPCLPTFLMGYKNWFMEDGPVPDFEHEDEIASGTLKDVWVFFRYATRIDQQGIEIALLSMDRLRKCDAYLVARFQGQTIGAASMSLGKGGPSLHAVYVLKRFRRKGVAYRLCESALLRFKDAGVNEVLCDVQSKGMAATLDRLARERPELWPMVTIIPGSNLADGIEIDTDDVTYPGQD